MIPSRSSRLSWVGAAASATATGLGLGGRTSLAACAPRPSRGAFAESAGAGVAGLAMFMRADDFGSGLAGNSIVGVAAGAAVPAFSGFRAGATAAALGAGAGL